jgi:diguanylate cyclase (GGDEF)-like protein
MKKKRLTLLIVENSSAEIEALRRHFEMIRGYDFRILVAASSEEALLALRRGSVHLLFINYRLAGENGLDLYRRIRISGFEQPVILFTDVGDERLAARVMREGVSDYLVKADLNPHSLKHSVQYVMMRYENERRRNQIEQELVRLARTDELTGFYNRRYFLECLHYEMQRARRSGSPLSLLMIDLDHFKRINDRYGHIMGDIAMSTTARIISDLLRNTDIAGRYGGEEFCVLLPDTSLSGARVIAERMRQHIEREEFPSSGGASFHVTCSIGIAEMERRTCDVAAFIKQADDALYQAKSSGRNLVVPMPGNDKQRAKKVGNAVGGRKKQATVTAAPVGASAAVAEEVRDS